MTRAKLYRNDPGDTSPVNTLDAPRKQRAPRKVVSSAVGSPDRPPSLCAVRVQKYSAIKLFVSYHAGLFTVRSGSPVIGNCRGPKFPGSLGRETPIPPMWRVPAKATDRWERAGLKLTRTSLAAAIISTCHGIGLDYALQVRCQTAGGLAHVLK